MFNTVASMCENESYSWQGMVLFGYNPGTYYFQKHYHTATGCDSIYRLTLRVTPTYLMDTVHTICENEEYQWRDTLLAGLSPGTYTIYDSLLSSIGCDSVYKLTLHVSPTYLIDTAFTICENESYHWRDTLLTGLSSGTYTVYDSLLTANGCDSVYRLTLTVKPTYLIEEQYAICENGYYQWRGRLLTGYDAGTYTVYDSLITANGCDSVYQLTLTVNRTYLIEEYYSTCDNASYLWRDTLLSNLAEGTYYVYDSLLTAEGCDSLFLLTLTVNPTYLIEENHTICENETYNWRGFLLSGYDAGYHTFYDSLVTSEGCDSVYALLLYVNPGFVLEDIVSICENESYVWRDSVLANYPVGTHYFYDSLLTINGCDSVFQLTLTVNPTYFIQIEASICDNENYYLNGRPFNTAGIHYDTLQTIAGCDSIFELTLHVNPTYLFVTNVGLCENQPYNFRGRILYASGVYYDSLLTATGCDSVYRLNLNYSPAYLMTQRRTICDNHPYNFYGRLLNTSGTYYDTLYSIAGCDSVIRLILTVNQSYLFSSEETICDNQTFNFRGRIINSAGIYYDSLLTRRGCDSVYMLTLHVTPTYFFDNEATICDNQTYDFNGTILNSSGIYYDSLLTTNGCDSIYRLTLTVNPTYLFDSEYTICDNGSYQWRDTLLSGLIAGTYTVYDSLLTDNGCDSVFRLTLTVNKTYFIDLEYTICDNESYQWRDTLLSGLTSGIYTVYDSLLTGSGCDSIYRLTLTVNPTYFFDTTATICDNGSYQWRDTLLSGLVAGTYTVYDSLLTGSGCDSVYLLTLTVNPTYLFDSEYAICDDGSYQWRDTLLSGLYAGTYIVYDSLLTENGCDSVFRLTLTVNKTYFFNSAYTICDNEEYQWRGILLSNLPAGIHLVYDSLLTGSGCDSIYRLTLTVNPTYIFDTTATICDNSSYQWRGTLLSGFTAGTHTVYDSLLTNSGCDSVYRLTLTVNPTYLFDSEYAICDNGSYQWRDTLLSGLASRTYTVYDSLQTTNGCDSIYRLTLTVNPTYIFDTTATICDNGSYQWRDTLLSNLSSGTYIVYDSLLTGSGCDSIYRLILTVNPSHLFDSLYTICANEDYQWRDTLLSGLAAGIYTVYDSLLTTLGCDSIYRLTLTVNPTYLFDTTATICDNGSYQWRDTLLSNLAAGTYIVYDSLLTGNGCDSVYRLTLTVNPTWLFDSTYTICDNEEYQWRDTLLSGLAAGNYILYDSLLTENGCDSIFRLFLTVYPTYIFDFYHTMNDNQSYLWRDTLLSGLTAGTYIVYDSLLTNSGCDSVYRLTLTVNPTYLSEMEYTICDNESYLWRDTLLSGFSQGVYVIYDSLISSLGADSVFQLTLTVNPTWLFETSHSICENETYLWQDTLISGLSPGTYIFYDSLTTSNGCDSVYVLTLTVNSNYLIEEQFTICDNESYLWHGIFFENMAAGIYTAYDSLINASGCDSIYQLTLTVNPTYLFSEEHVICLSGSYFWRGTLYSGLPTGTYTYYDSLLTSESCDSVYQLILFVNPSYHFIYEESICEGDTFAWRDTLLNNLTAGTYMVYDSLISSCNCDSIYQLILTVNPVYLIENQLELCDNESYLWRNHDLDNLSPGTYIIFDSLLTASGCDSVYRLSLTVNPTYLFESEQTICDNESFDFRGRILYSAGVYYDSLLTAHGCDSVYKLTLHTNPTYFFSNDATICSSDTFHFNGRSLTEAGIYYDSLLTQQGCDSVYRINLNVNEAYAEDSYVSICDSETYNFRGRILDVSGVYYDSLQTVTGCDSIFRLTLTVNPKYLFENEATICSNVPYQWRDTLLSGLNEGFYVIYDSLVSSAGCDSVYRLSLRINPSYLMESEVTICEGQSFEYRGRLYDSTGVYSDTLLTPWGCDSIYRLNLNVVSKTLEVINLTEDFCLDHSAMLTVDTDYGNVLWSTDERSDTITVHYPGTFTVIAYENGCESTGKIQIEPCPINIYLPNAITASNYDGLNDYFTYYTADSLQLESVQIYIYDRWGQLVFESDQIGFRWYGLVKGEIANDNVFAYKFTAKFKWGYTYMTTGRITVL